MSGSEEVVEEADVASVDELGLRFHAAMIRGSDRLKKEIGYNPTRFLQMVNELGGVATAKQLVQNAEPSEGFSRLYWKHRLYLSAEFHMLLPEYETIFSPSEREMARHRLGAFEFDIDWHLRGRTALDV